LIEFTFQEAMRVIMGKRSNGKEERTYRLCAAGGKGDARLAARA
jgi:hypothetical protein